MEFWLTGKPSINVCANPDYMLNILMGNLLKQVSSDVPKFWNALLSSFTSQKSFSTVPTYGTCTSSCIADRVF